MNSAEDLSNADIPLDKRLALALQFAISALNDVPRFQTHIADPARPGRMLTSYQLLPLLEAVARSAESAAEPSPGCDR